MYQSEKQFNTTASEHTIEEVYTNLDIAPNDMYLPYEGYAFRYPQRWLDDPSQNKMIGIRKLTILPTRHIINYYFEVEKADDETVSYAYDGRVEILPENQLFEILNKISDDIYNDVKKKYPNDNHGYMLMFDYKGGKLTFSTMDIQNGTLKKFKLGSFSEEFLHFLNQPDDDESYEEQSELKLEHVYENVWDRGYIEFHATFSDSKRQFIGVNNEFYHKPSLLFKAPKDGSVFNIRFTTDGKTPILPRYCRFIIQLCFVINYKNAIVK